MSRMAISMFPDTLTTYRGTEASVDVKGKDLRIVKFDGAIFDLWEIPELLRRLPLTAGYRTSLQVLSNPGGAVSNMRISVAGEENVRPRPASSVPTGWKASPDLRTGSRPLRRTIR